MIRLSGRVVKAIDSKSIGKIPRRFESCGSRKSVSFCTFFITKEIFYILIINALMYHGGGAVDTAHTVLCERLRDMVLLCPT